MELTGPPVVRCRKGRDRAMTGAAFPFPQPAPDPARTGEKLPPFTLPLQRPQEPQGLQATSAAPAPVPSPQALAPRLAQPTPGIDLQHVVRTTVVEALWEQAEVRGPDRP